MIMNWLEYIIMLLMIYLYRTNFIIFIYVSALPDGLAQRAGDGCVRLYIKPLLNTDWTMNFSPEYYLWNKILFPG